MIRYTLLLLILSSCSISINNLEPLLNCIDKNVSPQYITDFITIEDYLISKNVLSGRDKEAYLTYLDRLENQKQVYKSIFESYKKEPLQLNDIYQFDTCCRDLKNPNNGICTKVISILDSGKIEVKSLSKVAELLNKKDFESPYVRAFLIYYSEIVIR